MTKIKALQILVYITFGLFILQDAGEAALTGFREGYEDGAYAAKGNGQQRGPTLFTVFNGDLLTHKPQGDFKVNDTYTLQNISINAQLRLSKQADTTPWWLDTVDILTVFIMLFVLIQTAITINRIIVKIGNGTMFDEACIKFIRKTASLLLMYAAGDYLYQQLSYFKNSRLVHAPFLSMVNTSNFNFQMVLCAMLVYIIAEAFKQASRLKQEQDLTI